ncbi:MAG: trypsin-like serine protease [Deltaproteobacteria bacterium]|nr:trypsin-like serine protease [Deltaproteobacteria bacterium]
MIRTKTLLAISSLAVGSLVACSSPSDNAGGRSSLGRVAQPVIAGKNSDKSQDAVVLLVHYDPKVGVGQCTGTLLSPRLVLTARHCVADTDEAAACDVDGTPLAEGVVRANHKAETLYVFTGATRPDFGRARDIVPAGVGAQILDDGAKNLCNHDIALVLLKEPVKDAMISPIRLEGEVTKGEKLTAIGWGVTDNSPFPDVRQQRNGIPILGVGPDDTERLPVPPNEFEVGESICSGDSGGPALDEKTGAIVGVVSRGGNNKKPSTTDPAANCVGGTNLYTKIGPFKELIMKGFELAEAEPWVEGGPDPRLLKPGSACTEGAECRSAQCLADPSKGGATTCAADCSNDANACPEGEKCTSVGEARVCRAPAPAGTTTTTAGCAASPNGNANAALGLGLVALGLVAFRRRRR